MRPRVQTPVLPSLKTKEIKLWNKYKKQNKNHTTIYFMNIE
jgi:hypothetical protein